MRLSLIALSAMIPSTALAWPADGDWIPVTQGGVVMEDPASDHRHSDVGMGSHLDLVGGQHEDLLDEVHSVLSIAILKITTC